MRKEKSGNKGPKKMNDKEDVNSKEISGLRWILNRYLAKNNQTNSKRALKSKSIPKTVSESTGNAPKEKDFVLAKRKKAVDRHELLINANKLKQQPKSNSICAKR